MTHIKREYEGHIQDYLTGYKISEWVRFDQNTVLIYSDRQACADIVDSGQMPQNTTSDQGVHCLLLIQRFSTHSQVANATNRELIINPCPAEPGYANSAGLDQKPTDLDLHCLSLSM